jgi:hypothetical protein
MVKMDLFNVISHNVVVYKKVSVTLNENSLYFIKTSGPLLDSNIKTLSYMRQR